MYDKLFHSYRIKKGNSLNNLWWLLSTKKWIMVVLLAPRYNSTHCFLWIPYFQARIFIHKSKNPRKAMRKCGNGESWYFRHASPKLPYLEIMCLCLFIWCLIYHIYSKWVLKYCGGLGSFYYPACQCIWCSLFNKLIFHQTRHRW